MVASSVPDNDQQQISSSNIPGNHLDQSGHQPLIPLRLHLGRWGRLCATMDFGSDEIAPGLAISSLSLSLSLQVPGISSKHGVAGAEGAAMFCVCRVEFVREQKPPKPDGARTRWTQDRDATGNVPSRSSSEITNGGCSRVPIHSLQTKAKLPTDLVLTLWRGVRQHPLLSPVPCLESPRGKRKCLLAAIYPQFS